jgi:hypothetical protein
MTETELHETLAHRDWATAMAHAEIVAEEGDVSWIIIPLAAGRWAATDNAAITPVRIQVFPTRLAALAVQWQRWLARYPAYEPQDDTDRFGWRVYSDWWPTAEVARRYGLSDGGVVRVAIRDGRIHPAGRRKVTPQTWVIRAEEAERVWGAAAARRAGAGKAR